VIAHRIPLALGRLQGGRSRAISQRQTQQDMQPADCVGQVLDQLPPVPVCPAQILQHDHQRGGAHPAEELE